MIVLLQLRWEERKKRLTVKDFSEIVLLFCNSVLFTLKNIFFLGLT